MKFNVEKLTAIAVCVGSIFVSSEALARRTADDCLGQNQCAYVSPHGRVTCGPCPGQAHVMTVPAGVTSLCKDDTWSKSKTRHDACSDHGGVKVFLRK
jgi:Protein of unknown function (DUF3761)